MQFESRQKRTFWANLVLGSVPDVLIAGLLASVLNGGMVGFVAALVGLQVLYLAIWAKNSLWTWIVFLVTGRKTLASHIRDYLKMNGFPEPDDFERSPDDYLSRVVEDDEQPVGVRLKAAASLAELNVQSTLGNMQNYMRLSMAYEDALEEHKASFL